MVNLSVAFDSVVEGWDFSKNNINKLFMELLKVNLYSLLIALVGLGLFVGVVYLSLGLNTSGNLISKLSLILPALIIGFILMLPLLIFSEAISSVTYNLIDNSYNKKETSIFSQAVSNIFPILKYGILMFFLFAGIFVPFFVLIFGIETGNGSSLYSKTSLLSTLTQVFFNMVILVISFFLQFAIFELLILRKGVFESVKKSLSLVKNNFLESLVFAIIEGVISMIISIPLILIMLVLVFGGVIAGIALLAATPVLLIPLIVIGSIILLILVLLFTALEQAIIIPMHYIFWRKLIGQVNPVKAEISSVKKKK
ncbi:hypothetical protein HYT84_04505 [Candidatus Micrarchaeota archaeon]|nr:hypothetical protein [Candidatus Micrarchaeota archaeon]